MADVFDGASATPAGGPLHRRTFLAAAGAGGDRDPERKSVHRNPRQRASAGGGRRQRRRDPRGRVRRGHTPAHRPPYRRHRRRRRYRHAGPAGRPHAPARCGRAGLLPAGTVADKRLLDSLQNSRAFALAKIDRSTPDPAGGQIVRDGAGEPTGLLKDDAQGACRRRTSAPPRSATPWSPDEWSTTRHRRRDGPGPRLRSAWASWAPTGDVG